MRPGTTFLGATLLTLLVFAPATAGADTIVITNGSLEWPTSTGAATLVIDGTQADGTGFFGWASTVSPSGGILTPVNTCNGSLDCRAGTSVSLYAHWIGNDLTGTAAYNGMTFEDVGGLNSPSQLSVSFTGSFLVPGGSGDLHATAPFLFSGLFIHPSGSTSLTGFGTASLVLSPYAFDASAYRITSLRYQFTQPSGIPTPEPASMMLLGLGLVGTVAARQRQRKR